MILTIEWARRWPLPPHEFELSASIETVLWDSIEKCFRPIQDILVDAEVVRCYQPAYLNDIWPAHPGHATGHACEFRTQAWTLRAIAARVLDDPTIHIDEFITNGRHFTVTYSPTPRRIFVNG